MLEQLLARDHLARALREEMEQGELAHRELDLTAGTRDHPRGGIDAQVSDLEHRWALDGPRRSSARRRASSSPKSNGLTR